MRGRIGAETMDKVMDLRLNQGEVRPEGRKKGKK
jgi:hypothetical protein